MWTLLTVICTFFILWLCLIPTLSAISVNKKYWKYYKAYYKTLKAEDWELTPSGNAWWIYVDGEGPKMHWFSNGAIMLKPYIYIHALDNTWAYLDPYTLYWHWKYTKWFKSNLINK